MSVLGGCPKRGRQTGRRFGGEFLWGGPDGSGLTWGASGSPEASGISEGEPTRGETGPGHVRLPLQVPCGLFLKIKPRNRNSGSCGQVAGQGCGAGCQGLPRAV